MSISSVEGGGNILDPSSIGRGQPPAEKKALPLFQKISIKKPDFGKIIEKAEAAIKNVDSAKIQQSFIRNLKKAPDLLKRAGYGTAGAALLGLSKLSIVLSGTVIGLLGGIGYGAANFVSSAFDKSIPSFSEIFHPIVNNIAVKILSYQGATFLSKAHKSIPGEEMKELTRTGELIRKQQTIDRAMTEVITNKVGLVGAVAGTALVIIPVYAVKIAIEFIHAGD